MFVRQTEDGMVKTVLIRKYKTFENAKKAALRLNELSAVNGFKEVYKFLVYYIGRTNGDRFWAVGTKDYKSQSDDMLYYVRGKNESMPFRLKHMNYCKF